MAILEMRSSHRQLQSLSPRLQHAVRLLQMSSLDFATMLRDTLGRNPFLEAEEFDEPCTSCSDADGSGEGAALEATVADRLLDVHGATEAMQAGDDRDLWHADFGGSGKGSRQAEDGEVSAMERTPATATLAAHLHSQLNVLYLSPRDQLLSRVVVESLDDDGYLRTPLDGLFDPSELDPPPSLNELQVALQNVQALEPAGVAARDVGECLLLQLPSIECPAVRELARRIVTGHLKALAARDVTGLARCLDCSVGQVEAVCDRIRRLDPRPGWRHGSAHIDLSCLMSSCGARVERGSCSSIPPWCQKSG